MARYKLRRYLGIVFIGVVIAPAVVLSLLAIRALSREEVYIEKQMEGTLMAEVAHVSAVVNTEITRIHDELSGTAVIPGDGDPSVSFDEWKRKSLLVEIPFLLSPSHEILWPVAGETARREETSFLETQQAFLSDREEVPVYENIAAAYQNDILGEPAKQPSPPVSLADTVEVQAGSVADEASRDDRVASVVARETRPPDAEPPEILAFAAEEAEPEVGQVGPPDADLTEREAKEYRSKKESPEEIGVGEYSVTEARPHVRGGRRAPVTRSISGEQVAVGDRAELVGETSLDEKAKAQKPITVVPEAVSMGPDTIAKSDFYDVAKGDLPGEKSRTQAAISEFQQSPALQNEVYRKAEREGQQVAYRNIQLADADEARQMTDERRPVFDKDIVATGEEVAKEVESERIQAEQDRRVGTPEQDSPKRAEARGRPAASRIRPEEVGKLRSIFIAEPLRLSEIVARGESGVIPRLVDGRLQLLYWQKIAGGNIIGCLINSRELRDRIIGVLPSIYSPVRILTILDEKGSPLIAPTGHGDRDWQMPFVAEEISELLPRWETAAYLTDPNVISSRAHVTTIVLWILILILFVSIVGGGMLVLRSAYAEVRLAQQKTTFVANVSHELKTPLTSIRMFAEMLKDGRLHDGQKRAHYLDIMVSETERLTRLINNVLDFSRMERGEKRYTMKRCDVVELCAGVVDSQRVRLENNGFEVTFTTHTGALYVKADEEAIKQAVVNLLSNAEKYSDDVKQIEVEIGRKGRLAVISISDRGIGIPAAEADKIFGEFYRVDDTLTSKVKGAGLGLTIARRILHDHGGDIRYAARQGGGSAFQIMLPILEE
jgi:signal transduction histidine kinase